MTIGTTALPGVEIEAVIDTGFDDFLTLPPQFIVSLGLPYQAITQAALADGSIVQLRYYRATISWGNELRDVLVLGVEGKPLVGMALLYGHRLTIDIVDGGTVEIEDI